MADLKQCPFCGGEATMDWAFIEKKYVGIVEYHKVKCITCKSQTNIYASRKDAVNAWNKRVGEDGP